MNFQFATHAFGAAKLMLQRNAPTLMVAGGVVSMGAAVVTASKKTLDLEEILAPAVQALDTIEQATGHTGYIGGEYTEDKARGDRYKVYAKVCVIGVKHYAVPIALFGAGAGLVFGGHRILLKRNAALTVAFTTLADAFRKYRENAAQTMGPDFDRAMLKGYRVKEVINDDGSTETVNEMEWGGDDIDPYNRVFEQGESSMWKPDLGINKDFLETQQQYAQQLLNRRGYLYLSEVYTSLGFDESPLSRLVGWKVIKLPDGSKSIPTVDFGLNSMGSRRFSYNQEQAIYLDFNCQGLIIGGKVQKILEQA